MGDGNGEAARGLVGIPVGLLTQGRAIRDRLAASTLLEVVRRLAGCALTTLHGHLDGVWDRRNSVKIATWLTLAVTACSYVQDVRVSFERP